MNWLTRNHRWLWLSAALASALVQAAYLATTSGNPAFDLPLIDSAAYHREAIDFLRGAAPAEPYWQPPLYLYLLAGIYRLFGTDMFVVRTLHALFGVLACILTFFLARRLTTPRLGFAAALLVAFLGPLVFIFPQLLPTGPAVCLDLVVLLLALRALESPKLLRCALAGLSLGLAALAVPTVLAFAAVLAPALLLQAHRRQSTPVVAASRILALAAGVALAIAPVTWRNYRVSGGWVPISTNAGVNFYIGNNEHSDVTIATRPGMDWDRLVRLPYLLGARTTTDAERHFRREARYYVTHHPLQFAAGLVTKFRQFWAAREIPRNLDIYTFRPDAPVLRPLVWRLGSFGFPFGVLAPLALIGAIMWARRRADWWLVIGFVVVYSLAVALFFPAARYRAPVLPVLTVFAVAGVAWLVTSWQDPLRRRITGYAALATCLVLVNLPIRVPTDSIQFEAELHNAIGAGLTVRGLPARATQEFRTAIRLDPAFADAYFNLGNVLRSSGHAKESVACYRDAVRLRPDHDKARVNLAMALYMQGQAPLAINELELALAMNPRNAQAHNNLGIVLIASARREEAMRHFDAAAALDPAFKDVVRRLNLAPEPSTNAVHRSPPQTRPPALPAARPAPAPMPRKATR